MAKVTITREEAERGLLPPVCALTGVPTEDTKRKTFVWQPGWISVLVLVAIPVYIIVSLVLRKTMTVDVPLVREKHGHWAWRLLVGLGCILASLLLIVLGIVLGSANERNPTPVAGVCFAAGMLGFLVSLIVYIVLNSGSIRPAKITDTEITLLGVHSNFVDALEEDRDREDEEYERERKRRRDRDDEDERPRRATRVDEE